MEVDNQKYILLVIEEQHSKNCVALVFHSQVIISAFAAIINKQNINPTDGATILSAVAPLGISSQSEFTKLIESFSIVHNCKLRAVELQNFKGIWELVIISFLSLEIGKELQVTLARHNITELFNALYLKSGYSFAVDGYPQVKNFMIVENNNLVIDDNENMKD